MPRSSSRSASKPADRSASVEKRVTRETARTPASAAGKRAQAAKKTPVATVSTPKAAERSTPRGRSTARSPAKKPSPSPRSSGRAKSRSTARSGRGKKQEEEEDDEEEEEEEAETSTSKAKRAKAVAKSPVARKTKSPTKVVKETEKKAGRSASAKRVPVAGKRAASRSPRTPSASTRSPRAAAPFSSPSPKGGRARRAAKADTDDAEVRSPRGKRVKLSSPAKEDKSDEKAVENEEEAMETEEGTSKDADTADTVTAEKVIEKEDNDDFAVSCGYDVIDAKDVPAIDSAEVLSAISSLNAHTAVLETDGASAEVSSAAVPMEASSVTIDEASKVIISTPTKVVVDDSDAPACVGEVKTPVKSQVLDDHSASDKTPAKSPVNENLVEDVAGTKSPLKVTAASVEIAATKSPVKVNSPAEIAVAKSPIKVVESVSVAEAKSPAKVAAFVDVAAAKSPVNAVAEAKTPVKSPAKIQVVEEMSTEGKSPIKTDSMEVRERVSIESSARVSGESHADTQPAAVTAEVLFINGNSNGNSNGHEEESNGKSSSDVLFTREWVNSSAVVTSDRSFTLVSYNILADVHARKDFATASWLNAGQNEWSMAHRHKRFMSELTYLDADVICLQEVGSDYFQSDLLPALRALGYDGIYLARCNGKEEGEATFFRLSRFTLDTVKELSLGEAIQQAIESSTLEAEIKANAKAEVDTHTVALLTRLKVVGGSTTNDFISVANIHSAWDHFKRQDKQCLQVTQTMRELQKLSESIQPHIICGDFNSWKDSAPYQLVRDGHLNEESLTTLQTIEVIKHSDGQMAPLINYWPEGFQYSPSSNMKSAYLMVTETEPLTSRFPLDGVIRGVDFIWFSANSLDIAGVLKTVDAELMKSGAPSAVFPSDHLSLKAQFHIK